MTLEDLELAVNYSPDYVLVEESRVLLSKLIRLARATKALRAESRWTVTPEEMPSELRAADGPYVVDLLFQNFECGVVEDLDAALEALV